MLFFSAIPNELLYMLVAPTNTTHLYFPEVLLQPISAILFEYYLVELSVP